MDWTDDVEIGEDDRADAVEVGDDEDHEDHGIVAVGGELTIDQLRLAYANGIFPWPHKGLPLLWFCPPQRAILRFADLHVPASLAKARRQSDLTFTIDRDFRGVIGCCRGIQRPEQDGTWITREMYDAYIALHDAGSAHSIEAWDVHGRLVGGLYGVDGGGVFSGESMFHLVPNASKLALFFLVDYLKSRDLDFIDIQQLTPHMARLGAREISRVDFLALWRNTRLLGLNLFEAMPRSP